MFNFVNIKYIHIHTILQYLLILPKQGLGQKSDIENSTVRVRAWKSISKRDHAQKFTVKSTVE